MHTPSQSNWGKTNPVVKPANQPAGCGCRQAPRQDLESDALLTHLEQATPSPQPLTLPDEPVPPPVHDHTPTEMDTANDRPQRARKQPPKVADYVIGKIPITNQEPVNSIKLSAIRGSSPVASQLLSSTPAIGRPTSNIQ